MHDINIDSTKRTKPLVSVIVPTFKRSNEYLKRCINSLLEQTYNNIEIIIVDDNISNDAHSIKTKQILNSYSKHKNIEYVKTDKNIGAALSRNSGIYAATGDYITFLDDDDVYLPEKVEEQLYYMVENDLDMSFTDIAIYNNRDKLIDYRKHDYIGSCSNEDLLVNHIMHNLTGTPTYMYKTESLKEIGGFDNNILSEEYYLMEKSINKGLKIGYIPNTYVKAYRHDMGGESFGKRKIDGEKLLYKKKKKYFYLLSKAEKRYTRCRYFAVMSVSYYRDNKILTSIAYAFFAVFSSPTVVLREMKKRKKLLNNIGNNNER